MQVVCDDRVHWLDENGIVHEMLSWEFRSYTTSRLLAVPYCKRTLSSVGDTRYSCYAVGQIPEWTKPSLAGSLWPRISRVMRVKTFWHELRADCP